MLGGATDDARALAWLDGAFYRAHPALRVLAPRHVPDVSERTLAAAVLRAATADDDAPRLVVLGHDGTSGLGANLRMSVDALRTAGIEPLVVSVDEARLRMRPDLRAAATPLARPVVLFNVNADRVPCELARLPLALQRDAYRIGFFLWETSVAPATHRLGLDLMDEIWVPTEYVAGVYRGVTGTPVHVVRKGLRPPASVTPMRRDALGVADDDFVFLAIGDFHSSIPRKHPLAAVHAFLEAFPDRADVKLLLKVRNVDYGHWSNRGGYWQALERTVGGDPRIRVIEGELTDAEYWGLLDAVDAFVSLHRAEGFGYGIAHAMMRGRPVVVSDYSGSRDFCTDATALRVPVREVPVGVLGDRPTSARAHAGPEPDTRPCRRRAACAARRPGGRARARRCRPRADRPGCTRSRPSPAPVASGSLPPARCRPPDPGEGSPRPAPRCAMPDVRWKKAPHDARRAGPPVAAGSDHEVRGRQRLDLHPDQHQLVAVAEVHRDVGAELRHP